MGNNGRDSWHLQKCGPKGLFELGILRHKEEEAVERVKWFLCHSGLKFCIEFLEGRVGAVSHLGRIVSRDGNPLQRPFAGAVEGVGVPRRPLRESLEVSRGFGREWENKPI